MGQEWRLEQAVGRRTPARRPYAQNTVLAVRRHADGVCQFYVANGLGKERSCRESQYSEVATG